MGYFAAQGNVSLWITAAITVIGVLIVFDDGHPVVGQYVLSLGLFGFAGETPSLCGVGGV
jgi:hypothetical protein